MNNHPEAVDKITHDYLERVKLQLRLVPATERTRFLAETESELDKAYQLRSEEDSIDRILAVLRHFGEPAEVVSTQLRSSMASSSKERNLPLYVLGAILIAVFGLPLGFGGLGVVVGIVAALAGLAVAFCATAGSISLVGAAFILVGLIRAVLPHLFDRLVLLGLVTISAPTADFMEQFSRSEQNLLIVLFGSVCLGIGLGMMWLGKYLLRGLLFLFRLLVDRIRRLFRGLRERRPQEKGDIGQVSPGRGGLPQTAVDEHLKTTY